MNRLSLPFLNAAILTTGLVIGGQESRAALISNAIPGVVAYAFQQGDSADPNGDGGVNNVTNGDGLTVGNLSDPTTWVHDNAWQTGWQGNGTYTPNSAGAGSATTVGAWFIADLGSARTGLSAMHIWNVREVLDRGTRNVDIFYSTSPTVAVTTGVAYDFASGGWTPLLANHNIPQATGGGTDSDDVISLSSIASARYIGIRINSNYNSNFRTGFAEIQFATVPEPASGGLALLAGLGLIARRRR
ncbi:MAG TPA: PEP-CTERM sorting domain-containing protein [Verrucomicrobiales bacterium]|jgi:hypothetical protein|nr:PEP-CTERM sorting domain-containing protein [Verrucomicrobiales bacterium]